MDHTSVITEHISGGSDRVSHREHETINVTLSMSDGGGTFLFCAPGSESSSNERRRAVLCRKQNGDPFPKDEYIAYLKQNLGKLCGKSDSEWDYNIPDPQTIGDQIDRIMNGYDDIYEELIRAVCSVMVFSSSVCLGGMGKIQTSSI